MNKIEKKNKNIWKYLDLFLNNIYLFYICILHPFDIFNNSSTNILVDFFITLYSNKKPLVKIFIQTN